MTETQDSDDVAIIVCCTVAEMPVPLAPSTQHPCRQCAVEDSGVTPEPTCLPCALIDMANLPEGESVETRLPARQEAQLRTMGMTDDDIKLVKAFMGVATDG